MFTVLRRRNRPGSEDDRLRLVHIESEMLDWNGIHLLCVFDTSLAFLSKVAINHRPCAGLSG